jgi:hypothetical protein
MLELKRLSKDAVPSALAKAERYRLLNEPAMAESICLDILAVEPDNQTALTMLILAITDQFGHDGTGRHAVRAQELVPRLDDEYSRVYYGGIIKERRARALVDSGPASAVRDWLVEALRDFERAMSLRPTGNDDAVLRWNACARTLERLPPDTRVAREPAETAILSE